MTFCQGTCLEKLYIPLHVASYLEKVRRDLIFCCLTAIQNCMTLQDAEWVTERFQLLRLYKRKILTAIIEIILLLKEV